MSNEADILRKICEAIGWKLLNGCGQEVTLVHPSNADFCFVANRAYVLDNARRVLREDGVDVRWCKSGGYYWHNGPPTDVFFPTEAACVLAALEARKPKERWSYSEGVLWDHDDGSEGRNGANLREVAALLNAHAVELREARAKAYEDAAEVVRRSFGDCGAVLILEQTAADCRKVQP